jgi:glycosyltransferase involved in cell wall biosynthesis
VESCIAQDYPAIEVILVDDGSTDDSATICARFASAEYPEGKAVRLARQDNAGACVARNHGMALATGDYLLFLDSDDTIPPHKISTQVAAMEEAGADCSISDFMTVSANGERIAVFQNNREPLDFITHLKSPSNSAIVMRRSTIPTGLKWNASLKRMQDFDFMLRYLSGVRSRAYVAEPLYYYHLHDGPRISDSYANGMPYLTVFLSMLQHLREYPPATISREELMARYGLALSRAYLKDKGSQFLPTWMKNYLKRVFPT